MAALIGYAVIAYLIYHFGFKKGQKKSEVTVKVEPAKAKTEEKPAEMIKFNGRKYKLVDEEK